MEEELGHKKKTWMKRNKKWLSKWNIKLHECPNTKEEIKNSVNEKFRTAMWTNNSGCKKTYYIKKFNHNCDHSEKTYLGAAIKGKLKLLVAQLRSGSHHLRCEIGRWRVPKEVWKERTCIFCNKGVVKTEWHFVMECATYEDIHNQYENILKVDNMHQLFDGDKINEIATLLVKIHSRKSDIE
jgi:hypothetical protein